MNTEKLPSSPSLIKNPDLLDRLEKLAKEADRVRKLADEVAEKTRGAKDYTSYAKDLSARTLFGSFCGWHKLPDHSSDALDLFWNSARSLVAAQFSGFSSSSQDAIRNLLTTLGKRSELERLFWRYASDDAEGGDPKHKFARAFSLLSLYSLALPRVRELSKSARLETEKGSQELLSRISSMIEQTGEKKSPLLPSVAILKAVRTVSVEKSPVDSTTVNGITFEQLRDHHDLAQLEQDLAKELALWLSGEGKSADEVANAVRVLGGRYLNPASQLDPAHRDLYRRAVQYVLKSRNYDGTWKSQEGARNTGKSEYAPLAFVLDLPNVVLMPDIETLADTVTEVLAAIKRRLSGYAVKLPSEGHFAVNHAIYDGMMIGAAVADRLRDLLSDVELDALGAEVPSRSVDWEHLSDSLRFRDNLRKGAIDLWKHRSQERPGAILVFGPPGTGKTIIAASLLITLNKELRKAPGGGPYEDWRFLALSPADFARRGSDRIIASAEELFRRLQRVRRCVVLLDEMEEFLRVRGPDSNRESRLITTAFLPLLQETVDRREIILIVATNFVGTIDPAVTRRGRFDLILPLGPPDRKSRIDIIGQWLESDHEAMRNQSIKGGNIIKRNLPLIVKYTMGYTWAEIRDFQKELWSTGRIESDSDLLFELWRIRQERVPTALSGNPGCNWRTFRDEASRFTRGAADLREVTVSTETTSMDSNSDANVDEGKDDYWDEPEMPRIDIRDRQFKASRSDRRSLKHQSPK